MDGWETLKALRKIRPHLPAILSSGYDENQVMAGDHRERPQAFLPKPYTMANLKEVLRQVLRDTK
jgi:CheY-like chemotaxis protein